MNLWADFLTNPHRSINKWKHYFPAYERHLGRFVGQDVLLLEIGCGNGGSAQMWKRYLGPHVKVVSLDINPAVRVFEEDQISIRIGNQADESFLQSIVDEFGTPDVVIDDGSHKMSDINASFRFLFSRVHKSGLYIVEDLHAAYWPSFEGGLRRDGTFIELCKSLIDELNGHWCHNVTDFTKSTLSMHFYDSMVFFEKGRAGERKAIIVPPLTK